MHPRSPRPAIGRIALAVATACLVVSGYAAQPAAQAAVRDPIRRSRHPVKGQYLIKLHDPADADSVALETSALYRGRLRQIWRHAARGFAVQLSDAAARTLARDPRVASIEEDSVVTPAALQLDPPWNLDRLDQRALPLDGRYSYPTPGTPVNVYVVDSGIRVTHTEFGGRAFIEADFIDDDGDGDPNDVGNDDADPSTPDGADCYGHGTHIAATIGGATAGVAKNVLLWSMRVFDCDGQGTWSEVIAAVEAITTSGRRPAVVNLSLAGAASDIADEAIRASIAAGITYVAAAGNGGDDASLFSPSRIVPALVVGSTSLDDRRSGFSNWGTTVDVFAPGESIASASIENDTSLIVASGTSASAAHATGVAALYLGSHPTASPSEVDGAIVAAATRDRVLDPGPGPNRLLYSGFLLTVPRITVTSPARGVNWGRGSHQTIAWTHNLPQGSTARILVSRDGGDSYTLIAATVRLSGKNGHFAWRVNGPKSGAAVVRVEASDGTAAGKSDAFSIADPFVRVRTPNGGGTWTAGQTVQVRWDDNLGPTDRVTIALAKGNKPAHQTVLASGTDGSESLVVERAWATPHARLRVWWVDDPQVADQSDRPFRIRRH